MTDARVIRFDHVAIAVRDIRAACHLYGEVLGGRFMAGGQDPHLGIMTIQFTFPAGSKIELMTPARDDSFLHGYLDKHGEGFHHAAVFVDDLQAAVAELEGQGYEVVDVSAERPDWHEAFLRPRSAFGALVQVVQTTVDWADLQTDVTLDEVLDGEVLWIGSVPTRRRDLPADRPADSPATTMEQTP